MKSVLWKIIVITEEGGVCSDSLLPFWDPRGFLYKQETLLRSKVLLSSYKHLKQILFSCLQREPFPGCCPDLSEHTAPGERFCSGTGFDTIRQCKGQVLQAAAAQGVHSGGEPTGSAMADVTPSLSHNVCLT